MTIECEHGQLARACTVCYLEREIAGHEAVMRQALVALDYAADITDPQQDPCRCLICVASDALRERLGEKT